MLFTTQKKDTDSESRAQGASALLLTLSLVANSFQGCRHAQQPAPKPEPTPPIPVPEATIMGLSPQKWINILSVIPGSQEYGNKTEDEMFFAWGKMHYDPRPKSITEFREQFYTFSPQAAEWLVEQYFKSDLSSGNYQRLQLILCSPEFSYLCYELEKRFTKEEDSIPAFIIGASYIAPDISPEGFCACLNSPEFFEFLDKVQKLSGGKISGFQKDFEYLVEIYLHEKQEEFFSLNKVIQEFRKGSPLCFVLKHAEERKALIASLREAKMLAVSPEYVYSRTASAEELIHFRQMIERKELESLYQALTEIWGFVGNIDLETLQKIQKKFSQNVVPVSSNKPNLQASLAPEDTYFIYDSQLGSEFKKLNARFRIHSDLLGFPPLYDLFLQRSKEELQRIFYKANTDDFERLVSGCYPSIAELRKKGDIPDLTFHWLLRFSEKPGMKNPAQTCKTLDMLCSTFGADLEKNPAFINLLVNGDIPATLSFVNTQKHLQEVSEWFEKNVFWGKETIKGFNDSASVSPQLKGEIPLSPTVRFSIAYCFARYPDAVKVLDRAFHMGFRGSSLEGIHVFYHTIFCFSEKRDTILQPTFPLFYDQFCTKFFHDRLGYMEQYAIDGLATAIRIYQGSGRTPGALQRISREKSYRWLEYIADSFQSTDPHLHSGLHWKNLEAASLLSRFANPGEFRKITEELKARGEELSLADVPLICTLSTNSNLSSLALSRDKLLKEVEKIRLIDSEADQGFPEYKKRRLEQEIEKYKKRGNREKVEEHLRYLASLEQEYADVSPTHLFGNLDLLRIILIHRARADQMFLEQAGLSIGIDFANSTAEGGGFFDYQNGRFEVQKRPSFMHGNGKYLRSPLMFIPEGIVSFHQHALGIGNSQNRPAPSGWLGLRGDFYSSYSTKSPDVVIETMGYVKTPDGTVDQSKINVSFIYYRVIRRPNRLPGQTEYLPVMFRFRTIPVSTGSHEEMYDIAKYAAR